MVKRVVAFMLVLLVLSGCASKSPSEVSNAEKVENPQPVSATASDTETPQEIQSQNSIIEKATDSLTHSGNDNVEFTIPADFLENEGMQSVLDEDIEGTEGFISATQNEDGSVTCVVTKKKHKELMQEISDSINDSLDEMIDPENMPSLAKISAENDYTEFTVTLTSNEVGFQESFVALALYIYGGIYNVFNATPVDDITVYYVNQDNGDIIEEAHAKDVQ